MAEDRNRIAGDYVSAFIRDGPQAYIANLETSVDLYRWGGHFLPMTINDGGHVDTFVCSPRVGLIDYTREELARFPNRAIVPLLRTIVDSAGAVLSLANMNRVVHVNNWMMSTNLPVDIDPGLAGSQTDSLVARFPDYLLAIRSLTTRHSAELIDALKSAGWMLLPSRQIYLVDDVESQLMKRRDARRDERIWQDGSYVYEELEGVSEADAERIAELYRLLYLEKYSYLNPVYTARFVSMTQEIGLIRYLVLRDGEGTIQGFGGMHRFGRHATMPLIGYNTAVAQEHGLYRLTFHAGSRYAARNSLAFNMSSGAAAFKLNRGGTPEMEFTAYYFRHLPLQRRMPFGFLRMIADKVGVPILRRYQL